MRHVWPFQRSASVATFRDLLVVAPTAVQAERAGQATPLRELDAAPAGLGAAWVCHVLPVDRSTRTAGDWSAGGGALVVEYPTAVQAVPVLGQGLGGARTVGVGPGGGARRRGGAGHGVQKGGLGSGGGRGGL